MKRDYDLIILGGGSAGIVSAVMAGAFKLRTLLIERDRLGGECSNTGCVPSKALLHAASVAHAMRTAGNVGFKGREVTREEAADALRRVREMIEVVREADATQDLLNRYGVEVRKGEAQFVNPREVLLHGERLSADNFMLATGSRPAEPDIAGFRKAGCRTNQTIFNLEAVPETMLVVGGGPVGVEMAQAFQRLGSRVTLAAAGSRLLPHDDAEMSVCLEEALRGEGVDIRLNSKAVSIRRDGVDARIVVLRSAGAESEVRADEVLLGVGRAPNIEGLGLARAGVKVRDGKLVMDAFLRTTARHIYAAGDVQGEAPFSHMAEYGAKTAVRNILFPGKSRADFKGAPWTTFTSPEVAHVGLTEEEARERGIRFEVFRQPFARNDRALLEQEGVGLVKVLVQGIQGRIIGAHIIGPRAGELIQEWIFAMERGHTIRSVADMIHVYPSLSMANQQVAQGWYERRAQEPFPAMAVEAYAKSIRPHRAAIGWGLMGAALMGAGAGIARASSRRRRK